MEAILAALLIVSLIAAWVIIHSGNRANGEWEPHELKMAELTHIEHDLVGTLSSGHYLYGRPDRVYRTVKGLHIPVEYKTRMRQTVYPSDVAQLSLQAWLLSKNGYQTARHGYVAVETPSERKAHPVRLLSMEMSERLAARYLDIMEGRAAPKATPGGKCRKCGHRELCRAERRAS